MCRNTLSVGWDGRLYDCDFNQMLELDARYADGRPAHIRDFDPARLRNRSIVTARHCFGCTAGAGSSVRRRDRLMRGLLFVSFIFASPCFAQAAVIDAAGREIRPPAKVERVYAAGPPASLLVFAIAPDKLTGWTRAMRPNEAQFFDDKYAQLPELGRLTGRGNTANVEVVLKAKTDLIVDIGSTGETYASLANQVQEQTKIPYALFTAGSKRLLLPSGRLEG